MVEDGKIWDVEEAEEKLTPKQRVLNALFGKEVDRPPAGSVTSLATLEMMKATNAWFPEVHLNGEKTAKLAAAAYEMVGFDTIVPYFSIMLEAAAMGLEVKWGKVMPNGDITMPYTAQREGIFREPEEVRIPEDFLERKPTKALLDAVNILKHEYNDKVAIVGKAMGPWTLSYHLIGTENTLLLTRMNPKKLHQFINIFKEITVMFANALFKEGATIVLIPDHTTGDMTSPNTYKEFLLEVHKEIIKRVKGPVGLHCCGYTMDRMHYFAEAGWNFYHFESKNDAFKAVEITKGKMALFGNINNPMSLAFGSPEQVKMEALYALQAGVKLVGPECAIPTRVKLENLKAIVEVAKKFPNLKNVKIKAQHNPNWTPPLKFEGIELKVKL